MSVENIPTSDDLICGELVSYSPYFKLPVSTQWEPALCNSCGQIHLLDPKSDPYACVPEDHVVLPLRYSSHVHTSVSIRFLRYVQEHKDDNFVIDHTIFGNSLLVSPSQPAAILSDPNIAGFTKMLPLADWLLDWNYLVSCKGQPGFDAKVQRWVATNVSPGLNPEESQKTFRKFHSAFHEIFPFGIDIHLGEMMKLRNSQGRTLAHYLAHGPLIRMNDDFRMNDSVQGYNAFRSDFAYGGQGGLTKISLGLPIVAVDDEFFLESFRRVRIRSEGLPYPDEVISATFGRKFYNRGILRWENDTYVPNQRVVYDCLHHHSTVWTWHPELLDTESYCEVQCPSFVLESVSDVLSVVSEFDADETQKNARDDIVTVIMCCQWFADAINASQNRFYCNPAVAKIMAAVEVYGSPRIDSGEGGKFAVLLAVDF